MRAHRNEGKVCHVSLEGEWTVNSVADRIPWIARQSHLISEQALRFSEFCPGARITTEIDLWGITALDESGRRMLAMWLGHLDHRGFNPVIRPANRGSFRGVEWKSTQSAAAD